MKTFLSIFSSTRTMVVLLFLFFISIGTATFVENDFGTEGARNLVYNAKWFELLLFLGAVNIVVMAIRTNLFRKEKLTLLTFHLAFIVILIGAAITRYFGSEGSIHIRNGETGKSWLTTQDYLQFSIQKDGQQKYYSYPVLFASVGSNRFSKRYTIDGHSIQIKLTNFLQRAEKGLVASENGKPLLHLVSSDGSGRNNLILTQGETAKVGDFILSFIEDGDTINKNQIVIRKTENGALRIWLPVTSTRTIMAEQRTDTLTGGAEYDFFPMMLHNIGGQPLVLRQYLPMGEVAALPIESKEMPALSAVFLDVIVDGVPAQTIVWGQKENLGQPSAVTVNDFKIKASYGARMMQLPFSIQLNEFILKRYPGSESPSWFESNVQLLDEERGKNETHRIYMNHILKHRGYRFYQASYDKDEQGTILSLNRDWLGTTITYLGYFLMALGMAMSLLYTKSRFVFLAQKATEINRSMALIPLFLLAQTFFANINAQDENIGYSLPAINQNIAKQFGSLLVQDNGGRIEPLNTLASEVLRKVTRKEEYKGQTPDQVMLGMLVYPQYWQMEPMIRIGHEEIKNMLGIESKYASFVDFFKGDQYNGYALKQVVEEAYRKKPAFRSKFDNELIRVDERLNICYLIYSQTVIKIFPNPNDKSNTWHSPTSAPGVFLNEDSVFTNHILDYYFDELNNSMQSGNWELPNQLVQSMDVFQQKYGAEVVPSKTHMKVESIYNQSNIFARLSYVYLILGFLLLIAQFINIFVPIFPIRYFSRPAAVLISLAFFIHTVGLAARWYIAGHAPWSNGYEALIFIAWATVLAGLLFSKKSGITISATAILASLILTTAHLSWMDPQITNLVPVLKSYWLVIHVAIITASYGFLGLAALVAVVNLLLLFFESEKNHDRLEIQIAQLSRIIELTMIVGIYLLSVGTFLGGVWANESWGRYWAWDPKETWALATIIVYAIVLHIRMVPGLKGRMLFNILSLIGFASVIMTYFGVNYYLSGLHSYAAGDPLPVPPIVYYSITSVLLVSALAIANQLRLRKIVSIQR